jgi:hypothetical protein
MLHKTTMNQIKHTANTIYVLLDLFLMATPFRLFHLFFTVFLGSCYVLVNGLFFLGGRSVASSDSSDTDAFSSFPTSSPVPVTTTAADSVLSQPVFIDGGGQWANEEAGYRVRGWRGGLETIGDRGGWGEGLEEDGGKMANDIYNYLNWHKPVEAIITVVMAMFLAVMAQLLLFLLFRLRVWLAQKFLDADPSGGREAELQNIVSCSRSSSYNSTLDQYEGTDLHGGYGYMPHPATASTSSTATAAANGKPPFH